MSKYGLNLRPAKQKQQPKRPSLAAPFGFNDDQWNDVEREIALQASKKKTLMDEQQKKALEEDPTVFDYDGVYDKMKEKVARPLIQDREQRKVYPKERSKYNHLYDDKDKFITEAYRKKLAELERQMELERLCELQEERDDVTKKRDLLLDFYTNLDKNVAYGAQDPREKTCEDTKLDAPDRHKHNEVPDELQNSPVKSSMKNDVDWGETPNPSNRTVDQSDMKPNSEASMEGKDSVEQSSASQPKADHHKRSQDAVAATKERILARKKTKDKDKEF
ncbi:hypothetical protein AAHE18_19G229600 [Arachis hypogaea]